MGFYLFISRTSPLCSNHECVFRAFVPAVLLGEAEPKGVAEASSKAAEQVVGIYIFFLHN